MTSNNEFFRHVSVNALRGSNLPIHRDDKTWTPNSRQVPKHRGSIPADPDRSGIDRLYFWRSIYEMYPDHDGEKVSGIPVHLVIKYMHWFGLKKQTSAEGFPRYSSKQVVNFLNAETLN